MHYLRTTNPLNPENLAVYPTRLPTNRPNPYTLPGHFDKLRDRAAVLRDAPLRRRAAPVDLQRAARRSSRRRCPTLSLPVPVPVPVPGRRRGRRPVLLSGRSSSPTSLKFGFPSGTGRARRRAAVHAAAEVRRVRRADAVPAPQAGSEMTPADGFERVVRAAARRPRARAGRARGAVRGRRGAGARAAPERGDEHAGRALVGHLPGDRALPRALRRPRDRRARARAAAAARADREPRPAARARGLPVGQQARRPGGAGRRARAVRRAGAHQAGAGRSTAPARSSTRPWARSRTSSSAQLDAKGAEAEKAAAAARGLARRQGKLEGGAGPRWRARPSSSSTRSSCATCWRST